MVKVKYFLHFGLLSFFVFGFFRLFDVFVSRFVPLLFLLFVWGFYFCWVVFWFYFRRLAIDEREASLADDRGKVESFLEVDLDSLGLDSLNSYLKDMDYFGNPSVKREVLSQFHSRVREKLDLVRKHIKELEYSNRVELLRTQKYVLEKEVGFLKDEKEELSMSEDERKEEVLRELDIDENIVFFAEDLSDEEVELLKENDYEQGNEFSLFYSKVVSVLVKKVLNHKRSHTFLQWEIAELLDSDFSGVSKIETHETRDADITFKYRNRYYALEIETGSLLKKPRQLAEKVKYLNTKYKDRWMFIVTNKNNLSTYRKHGLSTNRKQVKKTLEKLLKINTQ